MHTEYVDNYFINPAFEYGIKSYMYLKEGQPYNKKYTFEMYVIKALTIIYGEKAVLLPYKIDNEKAFECNLIMYDLPEKEMKEFIKDMNSYYDFMEHIQEGTITTGLVESIENILLDMIMKRSVTKEFTKEEIREFDEIFNPNGGELKTLKSLVSRNQGLIINTWRENRYEITNTQLNLMAVNPNLLHPSQYQKYGYDIRQIAKLNEEKINSINEQITEEENKVVVVKRKIPLFKLKLSTGNGFVNALVLISIIVTEIMLGFVVLSFFGGN